ncbi:MAG: LytTR family DNA-binding domain-containing protein [Bacteroidota bacterium]|nr:LytTR family DNA-binding domain-containing protein [Bacteroidota bacterium]
MANELKTIIVEDELRGRNALKALLMANTSVKFIGEASNVDEAKVLIENSEPDLVLLDIEMPYKNGFDLLAELPNRKFDVIFTTAYDTYAIKAIKFSAMDYLLKPIDPEELFVAIEKTIEKRSKNDYRPQNQIDNLLENLRTINLQNLKLSLPTSDGSLFFSIDEIIRFESDANYTRFFILNEQKPILVSKNLKDFDDLLQDYGFCRVHHSRVINLRYIKKYIKGDGGIAVMVDGSEVEISRRKKEIFLKMLENFASFS